MRYTLLSLLLLFFPVPLEAAILHLTREGQSSDIARKPSKERYDLPQTTLLNPSLTEHRQALLPLLKRISFEERIPFKLLESIIFVESGFHPWVLNVKGKSFFFHSQAKAQSFLKATLKKGITNIDIGFGQINLHWHGRHFKDPSELLLPERNLRYGARLLRSYTLKTGSWMKAALLYHSADPVRQQHYRRKILTYLTQGKRA